MSPLELIGGVIALGLMGAGLRLYQINRKRPVKIEQPPSPRIIDEASVPKKTTSAKPKRKKAGRSRKKK